VRPLTYWCDEERGTVFCLMEAATPEAVQRLHAEAHGLVPNRIIEVDPAVVTSFLGRMNDPAAVAREPLRETAFRAIMFTDMASSTDLTNALGDAAAFDVLQEHHRIVRDAFARHHGREVDRAGDGFLASFVSAAQAVTCAVAIQGAFATHNAGAATAIRVRIGLTAWEPVTEGQALFGAAVNLGSRICTHAAADQILVAHVGGELCVGKRFSFCELGEVKLKGFPEPVRLHEVRWREPFADAT